MIDKDIRDIFGCLSAKKTRDENARRRNANPDEDEFMNDFGSPYAIDALQKILQSKAVRRLDYKTQVMTANDNPHVRTRMTHTYEVASVATLIARILGLNEALCQAIALGHDIGHAPFGHAGEKFISSVAKKEFRHEVFSVVVAQKIERRGAGLNLTHQVLEGILRHSRGAEALLASAGIFEEANVVMYADKIAYIWADINDIFHRTRLLRPEDFSELVSLTAQCGKNHRERVSYCVKNLCLESAQKRRVSFSDSPAAKIFAEIKDQMYKRIYGRLDLQNADDLLKKTYKILSGARILEGIDPAVVLAMMTDNDVLKPCGKTAVEASDLYRCSFAELTPCLKIKKIDFSNPDLDW